MTLAALMASDVAGVFMDTAEHAIVATYQPVGGIASTVKVIFDNKESVKSVSHDDGIGFGSNCIAFMAKSGTYGRTTVREGDQITANDIVWIVQAGGDDDAGLWRLELARKDRTETSATSHRIRR